MAEFLSARQASLLHAPNEKVEPVLPEKGLALENKQRHAGVAGLYLCGLIFLNQSVVPLRLHFDSAFQSLWVEPCAGDSIWDVFALMPVVGASVLQQPHDLILELQSLAGL